ncbi:MAG: type 1 glutamine amidotransferase domain-containing protein [Elusimicrobiota bacterium]
MAKKIAILIEQDYQDLEVWYPYYRLREAGAQVDFIAPLESTYKGKYGYPANVETTFANAKADAYDAVIVPGGFAPDYLRRCPQSIQFVQDAYNKGKIVASICHGPWVLVSAGILRGKKATCFSAIADDLKNAGARYEDSAVVVDGNLITSRKPDDLPLFCQAILKALGI